MRNEEDNRKQPKACGYNSSQPTLIAFVGRCKFQLMFASGLKSKLHPILKEQLQLNFYLPFLFILCYYSQSAVFCSRTFNMMEDWRTETQTYTHLNLHTNRRAVERVGWESSLHTCRANGFHLMFLSRAGVEVSVLCGRFFSVRVTPAGSPRNKFTKFFSCQPT